MNAVSQWKLGKLAFVQGLLLLNNIVSRSGIPILEYHRVSPNIRPEDVHSIYPHEFEWQMRWLAEHNYRIIGLDELADRLDRGTTRDKCVVLTFDDGHRDILRYAAPILERYSARATVFVVSDYLGKKGWLTPKGAFSETGPGVQYWELLSWDELRQAANVFDIGVHGKTHESVTSLPDSQIRSALADARDVVSQEIGNCSNFFCYPYGKFDDRTANMVRRSGFRGACAATAGLNTENTNRFSLHRNEVGRGLRKSQFSLLMTAYYRVYSDLADVVRGI